MRAPRVRVFLPLFLLSLVTATSAHAATPPTVHPAHTPPHRLVLDARDQAFVAQATADDAMQIELAKLAMAKSANPHLRALASKIIGDHAALNLQYAQLVRAEGNKRHTRTASTHAIDAMKARLQALQGEAFDQAFADMLIKEHRKIIAAYASAEKNAKNDQLRTIAARGMPVLQGHLDEALALNKAGSVADAGH